MPDNLIESKDEYKNLTDSDLDHLINGVFDEERIKECVEELNDLVGQEKLLKVPLLVFANK